VTSTADPENFTAIAYVFDVIVSVDSIAM